METHVSSEPELMQLARQFNHQALAQIYDNYSPALYRYAMRLLGDQNLAEDCVAETFKRYLQALRDDRGPEKFLQAYLFRTAHNWIVDQFRREPILPVELTEQHQDELAGPEENTGRNMRLQRLRAALRQLTVDQLQVITLKYLEGWENEEIARSIRKPIGAVKSIQHRALAALRRNLPDEELL
jgi:RNA polymerase sigma-70 factor (ECF subfamily)